MSDNKMDIYALLKLVRAVHGINAMKLLHRAGLFIDFGAIVRCVEDCIDEIHFLLEHYPDTSTNVDKFVKAFFEAKIDGYLSSETPAVESRKIRSATVRILRGRHDEQFRQRMERIYKTFCGYVHANYSHIMEVYNGREQTFNLGGVPSPQQRHIRSEWIGESAKYVALAGAFISHKLGFGDFSSKFICLASQG